MDLLLSLLSAMWRTGTIFVASFCVFAFTLVYQIVDREALESIIARYTEPPCLGTENGWYCHVGGKGDFKPNITCLEAIWYKHKEPLTGYHGDPECIIIHDGDEDTFGRYSLGRSKTSALSNNCNLFSDKSLRKINCAEINYRSSRTIRNPEKYFAKRSAKFSKTK